MKFQSDFRLKDVSDLQSDFIVYSWKKTETIDMSLALRFLLLLLKLCSDLKIVYEN